VGVGYAGSGSKIGSSHEGQNPGSLSPGTVHLRRMARSFAMCRFIAGLPLRNFARLRFGEVDRELERAERRRLRFPMERALEEREARFLRRRRPPPSELLDIGGRGTCGNCPKNELTITFHLFRRSGALQG